MDLKGSLVDTNVRIYPSKKLLQFIKTITIQRDVPYNIVRLIKGRDAMQSNKTNNQTEVNPVEFNLNKKDVENIKKVKEFLCSNSIENLDITEKTEVNNEKPFEKTENDIDDLNKPKTNNLDQDTNENKENNKFYLVTSDIDWLYVYLKKKRSAGEINVPFLHVLLEGVDVEMPENTILKRNPVLEERCVKLRAQQEAREYRKMTKGVDNVRIRFPEDSISYQLKQLNRQLIAIGQFILSIFAGFLFGFKGVEWMVGPLDFGFKLLLGVMCALIIALAEIYFLAKKLNEELSVPETVQLGGPTKFAEDRTCHGHKIPTIDKDHKD